MVSAVVLEFPRAFGHIEGRGRPGPLERRYLAGFGYGAAWEIAAAL